MSISQKIIDHGYKAFLAANRNVFTKVGYPEGAKLGRPSNNTEGKPSYKDVSELVLVAAVHEFGAPSMNIPERSFMRSALDENKEELLRFKREQYVLFAKGKITLKQAISRIGDWMQAKIQEKIRKGPFTPLFPETIIARNRHGRASDKPLIDTGMMINSVQHVEIGVEGSR